MKLIYRGNTYDCNPSQAPGRPFEQVRSSGEPYQLRYRGVTYLVDPNDRHQEVPVASAAHKLSYRGVTYLVNRPA